MSQKRKGQFSVLEEDTNFETRFEEHQDFVETMEKKEFTKIKTIEGNRFSTHFQDIWTNPEQTHQVYFVHDPIFNINYLRLRNVTNVSKEPKSIRKLGRGFLEINYTEIPDILNEAIENGNEDEKAQAIFIFAVGLSAWYDPRYLDVFRLYLEQSSVKVRLATIRAIGFQLWDECAQLLENVIQNDSNPAVRAYATETLRQIQQPDFDPDDLYENSSNYPYSLERVTEKGLMILPQIKDDLQAWMKQQGYLVMDALVLYQYLEETYGEFKPTDESVDENQVELPQVETENQEEQPTENDEPNQPELTEEKRRQQLQQELKKDRKQLASLKSQQIEIENRIENNRKTDLFGRNKGNLDKERDRLTQEIEKIQQRINHSESSIKAEKEKQVDED